LALQVRTVRAPLREDAAAARELFDRIDGSPPPLTCADLFQYDLREYYALAAEVAPLHRDQGRSDREPASPRADLVTQYNRALCSLSPKACPYQLRVRNLTSSRTRPGATSAQRFWRTPEARAAMDGRVALVAPQTHARLLPAGSLRTWEEAADEYLRALRGCRPGPRERLAVALQKTIVLARILPATDGVLRPRRSINTWPCWTISIRAV
jgi:hypothetical protein